MSSNGGHWPKKPLLTADKLPASLTDNPTGCYTLPEGLPCYLASGESGSTVGTSSDRCVAGYHHTTPERPKGRPRESCDGCEYLNPTGTPVGWKKIDNPMFGNRCYTYREAMDIIDASGGHWPEVNDFTSIWLSPALHLKPHTCHSIPGGIPCYR